MVKKSGPAVHPRSLILTLVILLGFIYLETPSAGSRNLDLRAELVAVINMNSANPLGGEIWLMNLNGKLVRRITNNNYHEQCPSFSPDGNKIVFVRNMGGIVPGVGIDPKHNEIFVYDLRTRTETRLTRNNAEDGHPRWSYDGKHIVFYSRRDHPEEKATLWIMESDGSRPAQILSLQPGDLSHLDPAWAPDGVWIAFVNQREERGVRYSRIEKVRMDGTQRTVVSSGGKKLRSGDRELGDLEPTHSPDGTVIWSARRLEGGQTHLFSFSAGAYYGGKAELEMVWPHHSNAAERSPRFSPDGRRIVLTRSSPQSGHPNQQIVLTDPQSSFRRYLTSRENWDAWHPSWYPMTESGAEREAESTVVSYGAGNSAGVRTVSAQKGGGSSDGRRVEAPDGVRLVGSRAQRSDPKAAQATVYEGRWKLSTPPERVTSLTLRYEGKLSDDTGGERSLRFQLMDWEEKGWVTVFVQPQVSNDKVKILHEIAPANFISRNGREIAVRIVSPVTPTSDAPSLQTEHLTVDVRRY